MAYIWVLWVVLIALTFGAFEGWAVHKNRVTLSMTVWKINKAWPPLGWVAGMLVGFLGCHFFWPGEGCLLNGVLQ